LDFATIIFPQNKGSSLASTPPPLPEPGGAVAGRLSRGSRFIAFYNLQDYDVGILTHPYTWRIRIPIVDFLDIIMFFYFKTTFRRLASVSVLR
jgi:hypothetical protein